MHEILSCSGYRGFQRKTDPGTPGRGKMILEEVHRFGNGMEMQNGHLPGMWISCLLRLLGNEKMCGTGKFPESIGVDTWAVDFVLLDAQGSADW